MKIKDDKGIIKQIIGKELSSVKLDLGCGPSKSSIDSIGIDILDYETVDLVGDIFDVLSSLPDSSVDYVYSSHFFEHIVNVEHLLDELGRVLKEGGMLEVIVPHFSNPYYYSDLTHRTPFGLYSFCYYAITNGMFRRQVPTYKRTLKFSIDEIELRFQTTKSFYGRSAIKKVVSYLVNLNSYTKELYEEMFCYLFPCYEIQYKLVKM